jgi:Polyketide cyclase / dehydrase and lipid transport
MKYTVNVEIHMARDKVVALFEDRANYKRWMPGLKSLERVSGIPGEVGSVHRLTFVMGKRELAMTETVLERQLPDSVVLVYESPGSRNPSTHRFTALGSELTRYEQDSLFESDKLMFKLMAMVMPGWFRKHTLTYMNAFKDFAESQTDEGLERTRFEPQP